MKAEVLALKKLIDFLISNGISFEENADGSRFCSFRVGGPIRVVVRPTCVTQLKSVYKFLEANNIRNILLGKGSNVLIGDGGFDGVVVLTSEMKNMTRAGSCIEVSAGASMTALSSVAQSYGLTGLEFAHGIPGSVGGGIYMNAGAYGGEISQVLYSCVCFDKENDTLVEFNNSKCQFSYRHSIFQENKNLILLWARFELGEANKGEIKAKMDEQKAMRIAKQPLEYPSAGSTFKRPKDDFAGRLIEAAGLKGFSIGGAQVSEKHAGFVINRGGATADDIKKLIEHIQKTVKEKFNVLLECEIEFVE